MCFIISEGGDPTGVGDGGQSASGLPFKDEFHSRLKFNHRGLLAMANANEKDANGSQFFMTLDSCEWLNKKHTIFGKVVGQTIFNMLRMGDVDTDANDRPVSRSLLPQSPPKTLYSFNRVCDISRVVCMFTHIKIGGCASVGSSVCSHQSFRRHHPTSNHGCI
jgi:cyclophilin family peptidyl-prolyl cis-trans isomerase